MKACFLRLPTITRCSQRIAGRNMVLRLAHIGSLLNTVAMWVKKAGFPFILLLFHLLYKCLVLLLVVASKMELNRSPFCTRFLSKSSSLFSMFPMNSENRASAKEIRRQHHFFQWNARPLEQRRVSSTQFKCMNFDHMFTIIALVIDISVRSILYPVCWKTYQLRLQLSWLKKVSELVICSSV